MSNFDKNRWSRCAAGCLCAALLAGCGQHDSGPAAAGPNLVSFQNRALQISFCYPKTWHPVRDDTILSLAPAGQSDLDGDRLIIDNPDLPLHIPGLIPLGMVVSGFEDDLKKRYKDITESRVADCSLAGAAGKEVNARATGDRVVHAILAVRGDRVYVIDAESRAGLAEPAFETVVHSMKWMD